MCEPATWVCMHPELEEIVQQLWFVNDGPYGWIPQVRIIDKTAILKWMESHDLEVLGHLHYLLSDKRFQIDPQLSRAEYIWFCRRYYKRCLVDNPDGEWAHNRCEAAWSFVKWFTMLWDDPTVAQSSLEELKADLTKLYEKGDHPVRRCIANSILCRLFERSAIRNYFRDWESDPTLSIAYREAIRRMPKTF